MYTILNYVCYQIYVFKISLILTIAFRPSRPSVHPNVLSVQSVPSLFLLNL